MSITDDIIDHAMNRIQWAKHNAAAIHARNAGACVLCAAEAGCRATDNPGESREPRIMHQECAARIARKLGATHLT